MFEKIQVYHPDPTHEEYFDIELPSSDLNIDDCSEVREWQGFFKGSLSFQPYFTPKNETDDVLELNLYESKENTYIVEIWDPYTQLMQFYCKNQLLLLDLLNKFLVMKKNLVKIETMLKKVKEKLPLEG